MKVLVTGAGGFLGFSIARLLLNEGHEVTNFSRSHYSELDELHIPTIQGDLTNYEEVENALNGHDAVFHVASKVAMWGKWDDFYTTNFIGTKNVIEACKKLKINKLVYTSTPSVVFGKDPLEGVDEKQNYPENFLSLYAHSKAIAEKYVLESNSEELNTVALRPHLIFGPRDKNIIPRLVEAAKSNKLKIIGNGDNLVDVIFVENAAKAHINAFNELGKGRVDGKAYFIGQEKPVNLWTFINNILKEKSLAPIKKRVSLSKAYIIGFIIEIFLKLFRIYNVHPPMTRFVALQLGTSHYFSHKNAEEDFNYHPDISTEEAIRLTLNS